MELTLAQVIAVGAVVSGALVTALLTWLRERSKEMRVLYQNESKELIRTIQDWGNTVLRDANQMELVVLGKAKYQDYDEFRIKQDISTEQPLRAINNTIEMHYLELKDEWKKLVELYFYLSQIRVNLQNSWLDNKPVQLELHMSIDEATMRFAQASCALETSIRNYAKKRI